MGCHRLLVWIETAVVKPVILINTTVHQDRVSLLHTRGKRIGMVGVIGARVIGSQQPGECRLLFGSLCPKGYT